MSTNPFSENSKKMICELDNVEYFELCETDSRVQCSYRLSYWAQEIFISYLWTCLNHTEEVRQLNRKRFEPLSISYYVIKKMNCARSPTWGFRTANL